MSDILVDVRSIRETYEAINIVELQAWPGTHFLPIAIAQLAIMSATPQGEKPDSIGDRLATAEADVAVVGGTEDFYTAVLNEEERGYVPAAAIVIGAMEALRRHDG